MASSCDGASCGANALRRRRAEHSSTSKTCAAFEPTHAHASLHGCGLERDSWIDCAERLHSHFHRQVGLDMPRKLFTAQVNHSGRLLLRRAPAFEVRPRCPAHPAHSQPFRGQPRARTAPTHLSSPPAPMTPRRRCERSQENALRGRMQKRKAGLRPRLIGGGCSRRPRLCTATPRIAVMVLPSPLAQARRAGEKGEGDFALSTHAAPTSPRSLV